MYAFFGKKEIVVRGVGYFLILRKYGMLLAIRLEVRAIIKITITNL